MNAFNGLLKHLRFGSQKKRIPATQGHVTGTAAVQALGITAVQGQETAEASN